MNKQRCENCKRKVFLPYDCKCGIMSLCGQCRMYDKHNCTYNWNHATKLQLETMLIAVRPDKVQKI